MDLSDRLLKRVLHAAELHPVIGQQDIASPRVAIPWLSHTSDVDHHFTGWQRITSAHFVGRQKTAVFGEDAGNVRMALECVAVEQRKQPLEFSHVVNVFWKDIFTERIAHRAVNERERALANGARQLAKELPALGCLLG